MRRRLSTWRACAEFGRHPADKAAITAVPLGIGLILLGRALWRDRHVG